MPRLAPCEDVSSLRARKAALDASLREGQARLRKEQKAACARRSRELAARGRALERACVILALHDSDRAWLPAFMREHGMTGTADELTAFDQDLCSKFLSLTVDEVNRIRAPHRPPGRWHAQLRARLHHQAPAPRLGNAAEQMPWHRSHRRRHTHPEGRAVSRPNQWGRRATHVERGHFRQVQMGDALSAEVAARYSKAASTRSSSSACRQGEGANRNKLGSRIQHGMRVSARFSGHASPHPVRRASLGDAWKLKQPRCHITFFPRPRCVPSSPNVRKKRPRC